MEIEVVDQRLVSLRIEHRDLDDVIGKLADDHESDDVRMRRMKKRKLALKDEIAVLESKSGDGTLPDSFCGISGHGKSVETAKKRRIHGTTGNINDRQH